MYNAFITFYIINPLYISIFLVSFSIYRLLENVKFFILLITLSFYKIFEKIVDNYFILFELFFGILFTFGHDFLNGIAIHFFPCYRIRIKITFNKDSSLNQRNKYYTILNCFKNENFSLSLCNNPKDRLFKEALLDLFPNTEINAGTYIFDYKDNKVGVFILNQLKSYYIHKNDCQIPFKYSIDVLDVYGNSVRTLQSNVIFKLKSK